MMVGNLHATLLAAGFTHSHTPAEWDDHGNGETGPMIHHYPAFNTYSDGESHITVDPTTGAILHIEARDMVFEAWIDEMAGPSCEVLS